MHTPSLVYLALAAGAAAAFECPSVDHGPFGTVVLSMCADTCDKTVRVPLNKPFALCDPCHGAMGVNAVVNRQADGFQITAAGFGSNFMPEGACVQGMKLEAVGDDYGRGAMGLQLNDLNGTTTLPPVGLPQPIPTDPGSFEKVRFCTNADKCKQLGDGDATCDVDVGECACSTGFEGKLCHPDGQVEVSVGAIFIASFKNALCSAVKNSASMQAKIISAIQTATGKKIKSHVFTCGSEEATHVKTPQSRHAQALQSAATGLVVAAAVDMLPSEIATVTTAMATRVAEAVASDEELKAVVGTDVEGRGTLVEDELAKCNVANAVLVVQKVADGVVTCSAMTCDVGFVKTNTDPSTCEAAVNVDPSDFTCRTDGDCTFDASLRRCADNKCVPATSAPVAVQRSLPPVQTPENDDDMSTGAIVGLSVGVTLLVVIIVSGVVYAFMGRGKAQAISATHPEFVGEDENEPVPENEQVV
eukprot:TRINITY_DN75_c1_g1_i1.p1 TRINITY_DN75_c1_g1~~TRINITY_DN75_c1_g1_i1.p1  ORF type:complete len:474 (+),score=155.64 TRINITY_DN75_c1_g1_i1:67-1488(+)